MSDESVKREGRWVTVTIGGLSATRSYSRPDHAKEAERRLLVSKKAREDFFRPRRERRDRGQKRTRT